MILFVSDAHLGQDDFETERAIETALVDCLRAHADEVEHLYLVGDMFDQYIEYKHLVPKGFVRLQGLLAEWTDRGVPVTYLLGNHDPWHRSHFATELGVETEPDAHLSEHFGVLLYIRHGDGLTKYNSRYRRLKPLLRHPVPVWMYRNLLPGDTGMRLARFVSTNFASRTPDPDNHAQLRTLAYRILQNTDVELVVMGHTHIPELSRGPGGLYLNPGGWRDDRTFGRWNNGRLALCHWNGTGVEAIATLEAPVAKQ